MFRTVRCCKCSSPLILMDCVTYGDCYEEYVVREFDQYEQDDGGEYFCKDCYEAMIEEEEEAKEKEEEENAAGLVSVSGILGE